MTTLLIVLLASPLIVMLFQIIQGRRRRTAMPSFLIPPADETAESVRRFREATERTTIQARCACNFSGRSIV